MQLIESLTMVLKRFRENLRPYHLKDENVEKLSILIVLSESKIMVPRYLANEIREGKLDEGTEMKKNNSKYEGSRHEMKPAYDVETLTNVKHDPSAREVFQDLTMLVVCLMQIILTMFNTLLNVKLEVPQLRDVTSADADAHHPGKVVDRVRLDQDGLGGGCGGGPDSLG